MSTSSSVVGLTPYFWSLFLEVLSRIIVRVTAGIIYANAYLYNMGIKNGSSRVSTS